MIKQNTLLLKLWENKSILAAEVKQF